MSGSRTLSIGGKAEQCQVVEHEGKGGKLNNVR